MEAQRDGTTREEQWQNTTQVLSGQERNSMERETEHHSITDGPVIATLDKQASGDMGQSHPARNQPLRAVCPGPGERSVAHWVYQKWRDIFPQTRKLFFLLSQPRGA